MHPPPTPPQPTAAFLTHSARAARGGSPPARTPGSRLALGAVGALAALAALGACAAPMTQSMAVSRDAVANEQLKQQQLALETDWKFQHRLESVALPLLKAAVPFCGENVTVRSGLRLANAQLYKKEWQLAARAAGLGDTVSIIGVAAGSGAERAGLKPGDRVLEVASVTVEPIPTAVKDIGDRLAAHLAPVKRSPAEAPAPAPESPTGDAYALPVGFAASSFPVTVRRDTAVLRLEVPVDTVCNYGVVAQKSDERNAFADGKNIYVTSAMMRFAADDADLATVVAHEISHNAMRHIDAKKRNMALGAFFGVLVDVAMATQGVNTGGEMTSQMAALGGMTFSQDFEREADYVGMYILARAGRDLSQAPNLWRLMATESPKSIKFASSHPTSAERFVRLEHAAGEIATKRGERAPLMPEMKRKR